MNHLPAPQTIEGFHQRLQDVSDELPKRMRQSAEFLAANSDLIAVSTVAELAAGAHVQPSAIMRFCQMMGFSGFSEMQRLFRTAYVPTRHDYSIRLAELRKKGADSPSALMAEFVDAGRMSLETLASTMDPRALDNAVAALADARLIHVIGLRRAFPVATYLAYAFERMQIAALLHAGLGKLEHSHTLCANDALIAITFSPYSQETIDLAMDAIDRKLPVVAVTDSSLSPLHVTGALPLTVSEVDVGAFRALSATLCLAMTLAVAVGARRGQLL